MSTERKPFKNWFDKKAANLLASQFASAWSEFDQQKFVRLATRKLSALEFSDRVQQFSDALHAVLPEDTPQALDILIHSLPPVLPDCDSTTDGWLQWPLGQFIADHGTDHLNESMAAMEELTQRFSAEFAIRPFVELYPDAVFERLMKLTQHPSPHVRRWCSEGVRSRLPWGKRLQFLCENPTPLWPILDALRSDEELYVRRSVANNLNDIAKDHPDLVIKRCRRWAKSNDVKMNWVIKHGLRSLIKAGNPAALAAIGYREPRNLAVRFSIRPQKISVGDSVQLTAKLVSKHTRRQKLMIDYIVHYVRKNGTTNEKVFKWSTIELAAGAETATTKQHPMRETTVRALYPGTHKVEIQINGHRLGRARFKLLE
ncbi:MAG: hypothetical protein KTR32_34060 [Granulosicoccus sp.]|nr:hypothetical protein [Granulosicoccus sp.]